MHTYTPHGVCSRAIHVELDGDTVSHVDFVGGCDGNLKAISKLIQGMTVDQVPSSWKATRAAAAPPRAPTSWSTPSARPRGAQGV